MSHREGEFMGENGVRIWYQSWQPEAVKAVVVVLHGLGDHSARYGNIVDALLPRGYAVCAQDYRGHGRSAGRRGHIDRFSQLTGDVGRLVEIAHREEPGLPVFLFGHSLGGLVALRYAMERPATLRGVIASSPALCRAFEVPGYKLVLGRIMSRLWPSFTQRSGLPAALLSRDPAIGPAYLADPLVHDQVSARLFAEVTDAGPATLARAAELLLPGLFLHPQDDPLVSTESSVRCFARLGSTDKTLHMYEGLLHEGFNEPQRDRERWLHDLVTWLDAHVRG